MNLQTFIRFAYEQHNAHLFNNQCHAKLELVQQMPREFAALHHLFDDGTCTIQISTAFTALYPVLGARRMIADLMCHEMIHNVIGRDTFEGNVHDSPKWIAEITRITPLLGLPVQTEFTRHERRMFPMGSTHPDFYRLPDATRKPGTTPHNAAWLPYLFGLKPAPLQVALQMMYGFPREIEAINQGIENPRIVIDFNLDTHTITTQIAGDSEHANSFENPTQETTTGG